MSPDRISTPQPRATPIDIHDSPRASTRGTPVPVAALRVSSGKSSARASSDTDEALREADARIDQEAGAIKDSEDSTKFPTFEDFFKTSITLEYGEAKEDMYNVHLELLRCYSKKVAVLFNEAQEKREIYTFATLLRRRLKALLPPHPSAESFTTDSSNKVMPLVLRCVKRYPLIQHQAPLSAYLFKYADDQLFNTKEYMKVPLSTSGQLKKKEFYEYELSSRFQYLNTEGILKLGQQLLIRLYKIKFAEMAYARDDLVKAAAQGRIILHKYEHKTVRAVVHWLYQQNLKFQDAEDLRKIYQLAEHLGIRDLAETCISKLLTATWSAINHTKANGISLSTLLADKEASHGGSASESVDPLATAAYTVFMYVLENENAPRVLQDLVIKAIANDGDATLYLLVRPMLCYDMALRLLDARYLPELKPENGCSESKCQAFVFEGAGATSEPTG